MLSLLVESVVRGIIAARVCFVFFLTIMNIAFCQTELTEYINCLDVYNRFRCLDYKEREPRLIIKQDVQRFYYNDQYIMNSIRISQSINSTTRKLKTEVDNYEEVGKQFRLLYVKYYF